MSEPAQRGHFERTATGPTTRSSGEFHRLPGGPGPYQAEPIQSVPPPLPPDPREGHFERHAHMADGARRIRLRRQLAEPLRDLDVPRVGELVDVLLPVVIAALDEAEAARAEETAKGCTCPDHMRDHR